MRQSIYIFSIIIFFCSLPLTAAAYKGINIDEKKFAAQLWVKGEQKKYNVSVVFVGKEARIVFAPNQVLPPRFSNNMYLALHLKNEEIKDPDQVPLRELIPPVNPDESNKDIKNWKIAAYWFMKVNLK